MKISPKLCVCVRAHPNPPSRGGWYGSIYASVGMRRTPEKTELIRRSMKKPPHKKRDTREERGTVDDKTKEKRVSLRVRLSGRSTPNYPTWDTKDLKTSETVSTPSPLGRVLSS